MAKHQLEFANFICRFGQAKVLLDLAKDVIIPAFTDNELARTYDDSRYFFLDSQIVDLTPGNDPTLAIVGRIVRDTVLKREQVYLPQAGLVQDHQAIQSAPSAIFVLILNTHMLLYMRETAHAPSLSTFRSTISAFAKKKHKAFIDSRYAEEDRARELRIANGEEGQKRITKKELLDLFPYPLINIVPLPSEASLRDFMGRYETLRSIQITLVDTNHELDNNDFFKQMRDAKDQIGAKKSTLTHTNREGLDKDAALEQLGIVAGEGNSKINLIGIDDRGDKLRGNNENFKVTVPVEDIPEDIKDVAQNLFERYIELVEDGIIVDKQADQIALDKIRALRERLQE